MSEATIVKQIQEVCKRAGFEAPTMTFPRSPKTLAQNACESPSVKCLIPSIPVPQAVLAAKDAANRTRASDRIALSANNQRTSRGSKGFSTKRLSNTTSGGHAHPAARFPQRISRILTEPSEASPMLRSIPNCEPMSTRRATEEPLCLQEPVQVAVTAVDATLEGNLDRLLNGGNSTDAPAAANPATRNSSAGGRGLRRKSFEVDCAKPNAAPDVNSEPVPTNSVDNSVGGVRERRAHALLARGRRIERGGARAAHAPPPVPPHLASHVSAPARAASQSRTECHDGPHTHARSPRPQASQARPKVPTLTMTSLQSHAATSAFARVRAWKIASMPSARSNASAGRRTPPGSGRSTPTGPCERATEMRTMPSATFRRPVTPATSHAGSRPTTPVRTNSRPCSRETSPAKRPASKPSVPSAKTSSPARTTIPRATPSRDSVPRATPQRTAAPRVTPIKPASRPNSRASTPTRAQVKQRDAPTRSPGLTSAAVAPHVVAAQKAACARLAKSGSTAGRRTPPTTPRNSGDHVQPKKARSVTPTKATPPKKAPTAAAAQEAPTTETSEGPVKRAFLRKSSKSVLLRQPLPKRKAPNPAVDAPAAPSAKAADTVAVSAHQATCDADTLHLDALRPQGTVIGHNTSGNDVATAGAAATTIANGTSSIPTDAGSPASTTRTPPRHSGGRLSACELDSVGKKAVVACLVEEATAATPLHPPLPHEGGVRRASSLGARRGSCVTGEQNPPERVSSRLQEAREAHHRLSANMTPPADGEVRNSNAGTANVVGGKAKDAHCTGSAHAAPTATPKLKKRTRGAAAKANKSTPSPTGGAGDADMMAPPTVSPTISPAVEDASPPPRPEAAAALMEAAVGVRCERPSNTRRSSSRATAEGAQPAPLAGAQEPPTTAAVNVASPTATSLTGPTPVLAGTAPPRKRGSKGKGKASPKMTGPQGSTTATPTPPAPSASQSTPTAPPLRASGRASRSPSATAGAAATSHTVTPTATGGPMGERDPLDDVVEDDAAATPPQVGVLTTTPTRTPLHQKARAAMRTPLATHTPLRAGAGAIGSTRTPTGNNTPTAAITASTPSAVGAVKVKAGTPVTVDTLSPPESDQARTSGGTTTTDTSGTATTRSSEVTTTTTPSSHASSDSPISDSSSGSSGSGSRFSTPSSMSSLPSLPEARPPVASAPLPRSPLAFRTPRALSAGRLTPQRRAGTTPLRTRSRINKHNVLDDDVESLGSLESATERAFPPRLARAGSAPTPGRVMRLVSPALVFSRSARLRRLVRRLSR